MIIIARPAAHHWLGLEILQDAIAERIGPQGLELVDINGTLCCSHRQYSCIVKVLTHRNYHTVGNQRILLLLASR